MEAGLLLAGMGLGALLFAGVAGLFGLLAVMFMRRWLSLAVVAWVGVVCFVPYWLGITAKIYFPPTTLIAVLIILALIPVHGIRLHPIDGLLLLLVVGFAVAMLGGNSTLSVGVTVLAEWVPAYIVGRLIATTVDIRWIYGAVAVGLSIAAALALVEFVTGYNMFVHLAVGNSQYQVWGSLQERGGELRAEGAFGHSIALGASLALGVPLAIGSRFRGWIKMIMVLLMLSASVLTFSRIGMICCILGVILCAIFLRKAISLRVRAVALVGLGIAVAVALPFVGAVFSDAGTEASNSASYRGDLLSLFGTMSPLGLATSYEKTPTGDVYFSNFRSIDSELVLLGLTHGLVPLMLISVALVAAVIVVLRGRATVATIAIVAQIPAFISVAMITQYAAFVWFVAGLAVTSQLSRRREELEARQFETEVHELRVLPPLRQVVRSP